jgi:hypothetical protein
MNNGYYGKLVITKEKIKYMYISLDDHVFIEENLSQLLFFSFFQFHINY